jgi:hypothetical protein
VETDLWSSRLVIIGESPIVPIVAESGLLATDTRDMLPSVPGRRPGAAATGPRRLQTRSSSSCSARESSHTAAAASSQTMRTRTIRVTVKLELAVELERDDHDGRTESESAQRPPAARRASQCRGRPGQRAPAARPSTV